MSTYSIHDLMRPSIRKMTPYSSARTEFTGEAQVHLDANEHWTSFVGGAQRNRYPDPLHQKLKQKIEEVFGFDQEMVAIGNGSDEIIDLLFRIFCEPKKDKALLLSPTYGAYEVFADLNDVGVSHCLLKEDFSIDLQKMETICQLVNNGTPQTGMHKLLFICSPNNPSGTSYPLKQIEQLATKFKGITVVDEAYIDFSEHPSAVSLLASCPRLVILRTFSKAWALADVRVGFAVAHKPIIEMMHKVKYPYNLSGVAQQLALEALEHASEVYQSIEVLKKERSRVVQRLKELPFVEKLFASDANFVLVRVTNPDQLCSDLMQKGIIIRNRSHIRGCYGCVRISIGSHQENEMLLQALAEMEE
ncbi:MAG: histidinol-phosphate transaminase [Sphaerochaetaceae bacterium]